MGQGGEWGAHYYCVPVISAMKKAMLIPRMMPIRVTFFMLRIEDVWSSSPFYAKLDVDTDFYRGRL